MTRTLQAATLACSLSSALALSARLCAQEMQVPKPRPVPPLPRQEPATPVPEPSSPPARVLTDKRLHLTVPLPAGWQATRQDGELSTFHQDARSARRRTQLHLAASLDFNPYPRSTFAGALFYVSELRQSNPGECAAEALGKPNTGKGMVRMAGTPMTAGHDEQGTSCTEERDDVYTTLRHGSCIRFDLVTHTFCGGEASGALDMTPRQLASISERLHSILLGAKFTQ